MTGSWLREIQLTLGLTQVEKDSRITQRTLAKKLGVALGLTNLYLKRLAQKGHIKITTIPRNRIEYLLTPRGVAEKSRLTYEYMQYSLSYYRAMRQRLKQVLSKVANEGSKRFVIYGTGELAELAYLTICEMDLKLVGFVGKEGRQEFLSHPLFPVEALQDREFDALLIADVGDAESVRERISREKLSRHKVITL